ncbi:MAG: hypothetical protein KDA73_03130 [Rhodobacteraceae bacterium]|nr:hypothetical protein [Paracoccaceae bacterium]
MSLSRHLIALCLALSIALTGVAVGVVRGQVQVAGQIVLCTGNGPVSVAVDAKGKPVGPPRLCPDCAPALLAGVSFVPELPVPPDSHGTAVASTLPDRAAGPVRLAARARGPPRIL